MKRLLYFIMYVTLIQSVMFSCKTKSEDIIPAPVADSFRVSVSNGYGAANFKAGDTVHIWSRATATNETFDYWSGDSSILNGKNEWHSWFIMPSKNINLTANFKIFIATVQYEKIKGKTNLKNVYYVFPQNHKGIVYLFHGSNGSANYWTKNCENNALIKDLAAAGFAVIVTEAEEVTLNFDTNGDGSLRWNSSTLDSVSNIDFANLKAITDTFYTRGYTNRSASRYCIGQSNGGSCSIAFGSYFKLKASVAYCASGGATTGVLTTTTTPLLFSLARWDNNSVMGQSGNTNAVANAQSLYNRGVCSYSNLNLSSPVYSMRFARNSLISTTLSTQIFNELKNNNLLSPTNYLKGYASTVWTAVSASSQKFPVLSSLTTDQVAVVDEQLSCTSSDHQFFSDYNKAAIKFLSNPCQ